MASRLITTLLGAALLGALASPAAADEATTGATPETPVADPAIAAGEAARERIDDLLDSISVRLGRLAPEAARRPAAFRSVAVQASESETTDTTSGNDEGPPATEPTTTTTSTTTTTLPPAECGEPDEEAIQAALDAYQVASMDAAAELEPTADELIEGIEAAEAALEAALADARTVADVDAAFATARAAVDTFYNGFVRAIDEVKRLTELAGANSRVALIAACAPQETVDSFVEAVIYDSGAYDLTITGLRTNHAGHLATLDAAKRAFLEDFAPAGPGGADPDPTDPPGGSGSGSGGGGNGDGDGGRVPSDAGSGSGGLPFTGLAALVPLLISALVLIGLGSVTVVAARRRRVGNDATG